MLNHRFPKSERLLTSQDFAYLKSQSQKFKTHSVMVFYKPSRNTLDCARIGLSVSKKVGKAHRRNRLKRLIREFFRHSLIRTLPIDFMLVVSPRLDRHQSGEAHSEAQLLLSLEKLESFLKRRL